MFILVVNGLAFVGIGVAVLGYGLSEFDLSFDDVYERRLEARAAGSPFPGATYLLTWLKSPLLPILIVVGIAWRSKVSLGVGLLSMLVLFSLTGQKVVFVIPLIAIAAYLSAQPRFLSNGKPWFGLSITGLVAIPVVVSTLLPTSNFEYLVTRRVALVPGMLSHKYVEYVADGGFSLFSHSWLKWFTSGEERQSIGSLVGTWLGDPDLNANANPFADGYASAGYAGVVIIAVGLAMVLLLMDKLAASRSLPISVGVFVAVGNVYVNGYLHTSLLDGGVLLAAALIWLLPASTGDEVSRASQREERSDQITPRRASP